MLIVSCTGAVEISTTFHYVAPGEIMAMVLGLAFIDASMDSRSRFLGNAFAEDSGARSVRNTLPSMTPRGLLSELCGVRTATACEVGIASRRQR